MKAAFVTPRYGPEVIGGAEAAARALAEHLVADAGWEAEVFTTCARDHVTWENELPPGDTTVNGVQVHRFPTDRPRDPEGLVLDGRLRRDPWRATLGEARRWVDLNGPVSSPLVEAVPDAGADVAVFYPYLYHPTVAAIGSVPMPAVLHPAAHDEPALYLPVFADTFTAADALVFHTVAERRLVQGVHPVGGRPQILLGVGVTAPRPRRRAGADVLGIGDRPYVVSVGRVDAHKGSRALVGAFCEYKARRPGPLALALVGPVACDIPAHPDVVLTGTVAEQDKDDIVRDALVAVAPSALEAFCLVVPEAWMAGVPVLVNAACGATRELCERSGGGVWYGSYAELEASLDRLVGDDGLRRRLAASGRTFVDGHYRWPLLVQRYAGFLARVASRGRRR
jgi:glycosyltransferase involved in cell wall biosynthesis